MMQQEQRETLWGDGPAAAGAEVGDHLAVVRLDVGHGALPAEWLSTGALELSLGPESPSDFYDVAFTVSEGFGTGMH